MKQTITFRGNEIALNIKNNNGRRTPCAWYKSRSGMSCPTLVKENENWSRIVHCDECPFSSKEKCGKVAFDKYLKNLLKRR